MKVGRQITMAEAAVNKAAADSIKKASQIVETTKKEKAAAKKAAASLPATNGASPETPPTSSSNGASPHTAAPASVHDADASAITVAAAAATAASASAAAIAATAAAATTAPSKANQSGSAASAVSVPALTLVDVAAASHAASYAGPAEPRPRNGVDTLLEVLGDTHIAYSAMRVPQREVSIIGARPFSKASRGVWGSCHGLLQPVSGHCGDHADLDPQGLSGSGMVVKNGGVYPPSHTVSRPSSSCAVHRCMLSLTIFRSRLVTHAPRTGAVAAISMHPHIHWEPCCQGQVVLKPCLRLLCGWSSSCLTLSAHYG